MMEDDIIPIDSAVNDFSFHLSNHPRTILSAGFGEGKTFFLDRCKSELTDYTFITLYPVNYQVVSNEDIFELVKRDILFQLFINDILVPKGKVSRSVALSFFLANPRNYFEWIVSAVSALDYPDFAAVKAISKAYKFFKQAHSVYSKFCQSNQIEESDCIKLWDKIESKGIYECDVITKLIIDSITSWKKKNPEKRLVLLVEDLDRIDPAHLFRILNVLSAHIDYSYKFGISPCRDSIEGNKFGFDNIVCVLDYDNLISIFRHFYGEYTSWDGYISKFSTKGYFKYSLSEQKCNYYYKKAALLCGIDETIFRKLIKEEVVKSTSMRVLNASLNDIDSQFSHIPNYNKDGTIKEYPLNLLRFFVVLRRMGIEDKQIIETTVDGLNSNPKVKDMVMPYYFLMNDKKLCVVSFGEKNNGYLVRYNFTVANFDRQFKYESDRLSGYDNNSVFPSFNDIVKFMLSKVGK